MHPRTNAPPISAALAIADVAGAAIEALEKRREERGLGEAELAQLIGFEVLRAEARDALSGSVSMSRINRSTAELRGRLAGCSKVIGSVAPLLDLLDMGGVLSADWHDLPLSLDLVLYFWVARLAGDLSLICAAGAAHARRRAQLTSVRGLKDLLGEVIGATCRAPFSEEEVARTTDRADRKFTRVTFAIGADLPAIRAEAAALRARR